MNKNTINIENKGILYGVGVGPGDPELMTVKATNTIKSCQVLAVPSITKEQAASYQIALGLLPEIADKDCLELSSPMTKEKALLDKAYEESADKICKMLDAGKNVAYLTLGDPTIYSTYIYIHRIVKARGYNCQIIPGVPSFCAAGALLSDSLADRCEELHIIPSSYDTKQAINLPGTKIFMKAGSKIHDLIAYLKANNQSISVIENCGWPDEKVYLNEDELPERLAYFSLTILRDKAD